MCAFVLNNNDENNNRSNQSNQTNTDFETIARKLLSFVAYDTVRAHGRQAGAGSLQELVLDKGHCETSSF